VTISRSPAPALALFALANAKGGQHGREAGDEEGIAGRDHVQQASRKHSCWEPTERGPAYLRDRENAEASAAADAIEAEGF